MSSVAGDGVDSLGKAVQGRKVPKIILIGGKGGRSEIESAQTVSLLPEESHYDLSIAVLGRGRP